MSHRIDQTVYVTKRNLNYHCKGDSLHFPLLSGTSWVEVESPVKEVEALHVAVGVSVVWVVTKDYKVNQYSSHVQNSE